MKATRRRSVNIGGSQRRPARRTGRPGTGPPPCRSPLPVSRPLTAERITRVFTPCRSGCDTSSSVVRCTVAPSQGLQARWSPRTRGCMAGIDQCRWQSLTRGDEPISGGRRPLPDEPWNDRDGLRTKSISLRQPLYIQQSNERTSRDRLYTSRSVTSACIYLHLRPTCGPTVTECVMEYGCFRRRAISKRCWRNKCVQYVGYQ